MRTDSNSRYVRHTRIPACLLLALAAVLIVLGLKRGETALILRQAVNVCFECMGLG